MKDAGFIIGSYVLTFSTIAALSWHYIRSGRRLTNRVDDDDKYWR